MGNNNSQQIHLTPPIQKELNPIELKYTFYWQSNSDPYDSNQFKTWEKFDTSNQNHLNEKYGLYIKDTKNFIFPLLHPSENYNVDFKQMKQIHRIDTFRNRPIKVEKLQQTTEINKNYLEEEYQFFWKKNKDP